MNTAPLFPETSECPKDGAAYWAIAEDGVKIRVSVWKANAASEGTIFFFPGRTEYAEKYGKTVSAFHEAGFSSLVVDWRGQGLAGRSHKSPNSGHVDAFSEYQRDVDAVKNAAETLGLPKPWFVVGHSMGACIALRALIEGFPAESCAFTGPMWDIHVSPVQRVAAWGIAGTMRALGKGHLYAPGRDEETYVLTTNSEENRLTHDPEMFNYMHTQASVLIDHQIGGPSVGWVFESLRETRALSKRASPNVPCITFCGLQDEVVGIQAVKDRMDRWPYGQLKMIPNAKHDLFSEVPSVRGPMITEIINHFKAA